METTLTQIGFRENRTYKAPSGQVYRAVRYRDERIVVWAAPTGPDAIWAPVYEEVSEVVRLITASHGSVEFVDAGATGTGAMRYRFNILSLSRNNPEEAD